MKKQVGKNKVVVVLVMLAAAVFVAKMLGFLP